MEDKIIELLKTENRGFGLEEIADYLNITKTNELIQNANKGLTNTFSEAGGNNIFRNTGLWFAQNDEENPYEYWIGKVKRISKTFLVAF